MSAGLSLVFPDCDIHVAPIHQYMLTCSDQFKEKYTADLFERLEEFWGRPSKFIRSLTLTYIAEQFGGDVTKAHAAGAALEIYHAASLIFDDMQDGSEIRRRGKAVHVTDGLSLAMSLGGILRSLMYHPINLCESLSDQERSHLHASLDRACTNVACGQGQEMLWRKYPELDIEGDAYINMISKKTGCLIATAFWMGAYIGGADPKTTSQLAQFGEDFGVVFQLHNDLMDLAGGEMIGRPAYDDLKSCKRTYIVVSCLNELKAMGAEEDLQKFIGLLRNRRLDDAQVDWCVEQLNRTNQIEAAQKDLLRRLDELAASVDVIDAPAPLKEMLKKLLLFFITTPSDNNG